MGFKKNNPGCNCCAPSCVICDGDCGWTTISGSPDLSTPGVVAFFSSTGLVLSDAQATSGIIRHYISVQASGDTNGDQLRLYFKYKDANNYWYLQATLGTTGTLKLFEMTGGVGPTERASASLARSGGTPCFLRVCYGRGIIICAEDYSSTSFSYSTTTDIDDQLSAGVGVGTVSSGAAFDTFYYAYSFDEDQKPDCDPCDLPSGLSGCGNCDSGTVYFQYKVTIAGGSAYDGTYYVSRQADRDLSGGTNPCYWDVPVTGLPCGITGMILNHTSLNVRVSFDRPLDGLGAPPIWNFTTGGPTHDCSTTRVMTLLSDASGTCSTATGTTATMEFVP